MRSKRLLSFLLAFVLCASFLPQLTPVSAAESDFKIVVGENMTEMQEYAAKELRKYLYQLSGEDVPIVPAAKDMDLTNAFVLGTQGSNSLLSAVRAELDSLRSTGAAKHEGEQGYVLKKTDSTLYIAGTDDEGTLYGVYGLLDDYYGIGFYFSGDVIPAQKSALYMPAVDEAKTPRQYMRGVLPWTNFPQSATVYSTEDWMFVIDQMARMRMNFLNIHNYNAQNGHNELFHNFTYNGIMSRNWNCTAKTGHGWGCPGWDVNQYLFGATDLFDDYDFGTDATLHNDNLDNYSVFGKGRSQFEFLIEYGHSRGVKMGLGLDIDIVMADYGAAANAPGLPEAQAKAVLENYEELDTLILYISESVGTNAQWLATWKDCFERMYKTIRAERPDMQIAVSGWGVSHEIANYIYGEFGATDVVIAPISNYSAGFVTGKYYYGIDKEYWGGPWVERDFDSSVYFYPFKMELSDTINAYQQNKDSMSGMFTLSWRLTDGVDAKMAYIAKAPWDLDEKYTTAEAVYGEYASRCYGVGLDQSVIADLTKLICTDEKTVVPTLWSECNATPNFTNANRITEINAMQGMIERVDAAISASADSGAIARMNKLRDRLICAQYYCKLDSGFNSTQWEKLQDDFSVWAKSFMTRVDDISSLGNNQSAQNRFVQQHYVARETALRNEQEIKAPINVVAKGTPDGAILTWEYESGIAQGFNVYRDGVKLNGEPLSGDERSYEDVYTGAAVYTVTAVTADGEGIASIGQHCDAGGADTVAPQAIVVSPHTSRREGQDMEIKARLLDGRAYSELSAEIHYRAMGSDGPFTSAAMEHRVKSTFTANVGTTGFADTGIEYYLTVSDGTNESVWPVTGGKDGLNAVCTVYSDSTATRLRAPLEIEAENGGIRWSDAGGAAYQYRIYRDADPGFRPSKANYVTYVEKGTTSFTDIGFDFDGSSLADKTYYYRVTTVDRYMNESMPSEAVSSLPIYDDTLDRIPFIKADEMKDCRAAAQAGSKYGNVIGWVEDGGYAVFEGLVLPEKEFLNALEVTYSAQTGGGKVEIWIDGLPDSGGTKLGEAVLYNTGQWSRFTTVSILLNPCISGTHDLYFVFNRTGTSGEYLFNLDYFRFASVIEPSENDIAMQPMDMMAFRASVESTLRGDTGAVTNFGNQGDRIVLGEHVLADDERLTVGGGASVVALPGYGLKCIATFGPVGTWAQFDDVPEGKVYLAYDKHYPGEEHALSVYVGEDGDEPVNILPMEGTTGSSWNQGQHKILYIDTGVVSDGETSIKFQCDVLNNLNLVAVFAEQKYSAKQLDITYSNTSDTQCSLYINGEKAETLVFPDSGGGRETLSVVIDISDALIELVAEDEDIIANGATVDGELIGNDGAKLSVYGMTLCEEERALPSLAITASAGEGGSISPEGNLTVEYGKDQSFEITPDVGYVVEKVIVNGLDLGARSSYTFERLTYDATIEAVFKAKTYKERYDISLSENASRCVTVSARSAAEGQPVNIDLIPNYRVTEGTLRYTSASEPDGVAISERNLQFIMPGEAVTIEGEFEAVGGGGMPGKSYKITIEETENGKIEASSTSAGKGARITLTATPDEGYELKHIAAVDADGKNLVLTEISEERFSFSMPDSDVTVSGKFGKLLDIPPEKPPLGEGPPFIDISEDDWFYEAVNYAYNYQLMKGTSTYRFEPNASLTRAMMAQLLYNHYGSDAKGGNAFSDVPEGAWYADAVNWAADNGIVSGYGNGKFGPDDDISRQQMALILFNYAQFMGCDTDARAGLGNFKDASEVAGWAEDAMKWAVAETLVSGMGDGTVFPNGTATRAEVATILMRFCEHYLKRFRN